MTPSSSKTPLFKEAQEQFIKDCRDRYTSIEDIREYEEFLRQNASPKEAEEVALKIKADSEKKWVKREHHDKRNLGKWINGIMDNISTFIAIGDSTMQGAPQSVGLAWFAVRLSLTAVVSNYELYQLFANGISDVTDIMVIVVHYELLYNKDENWNENPTMEKIFSDIVKTYAAVLNFSLSVKRHLSGGTMAKIRHGFKDVFGQSKAKFEEKLETIANLKLGILEASQVAFQDETLRQIGSIQDIVLKIESTVNDIRSFQSTVKNLSQQMNELSARTRVKTQWELAVDVFDKHRNGLKTLKNPISTLGESIDLRHDGTCQWIFEQPTYQMWRDWKTKKSVLCLEGQEGSGKSVVLATVVESLDGTMHDNETLLYLSCGSTRNDETRYVPTVDNVCGTLLHQLYSMAQTNDQDVSLLEACNKAFENPKSKDNVKKGNEGIQSKSSLVARSVDQAVPDFVDVFTILLERLQAKVTVVLDQVECMSLEEQKEIGKKFADVLEQISDEVSLRVVIACRSMISYDKALSINVGDFNHDDMEKMLIDELKQIPGLDETEILEATEAICDKAGTQFAYISKIGLPFMREPFQRPLSRRLETLPTGWTTVYNEELRKMESNYVDLLRTALTWTLLARIDVNVKAGEIMDAYNKRYDRRDLEMENKSRDHDLFKFPPTPNLEIDQLSKAAGAFIQVKRDEASEGHIVVLKDPVHVRDFCLATGGSTLHDEYDDKKICIRCKTSLVDTKSVAITEKHGHLQLAQTCLRHLNNPVFQQRTIGDPVANLDCEDPKKALDANGIESTPNAPASLDTEDVDNKTQAINTDQSQGELENDLNTTNEESTETMGFNEQPDFSSNQSDADSDNSMDDEDRYEDNEDDFFDSSADSDHDIKVHRYELHCWMYHLRKAETLWPAEERIESQEWHDIYEELDYFTSVNISFFHHWQNKYSSFTGDEDALTIAAMYGLIGWTQHMLVGNKNDNGRSPSERALSALSAATQRSDNIGILKLLLDQCEEYRDTKTYQDAFRSSLVNDPSFDTIKLWLDHGGNPTLADEDGWIGLHYFALRGDDTRVLDILLNHSGDDAKSQIIVETIDKDTPLHMLLWRPEVPEELLQKFLEHGADVNSDDEMSKRPLQLASRWGDIRTLKILLDFNVSDINDDDTDGDTAVHMAVAGDHTKCTELLAKKGANVNKANRRGRVPLHDSAWYGSKECVEILLGHDAQLDILDKHKRSPLFFACLGHNLEVVEILLDRMLDEKIPVKEINQLTKNNRSVMRQAASHGFHSVIEKLIRRAGEEDDLESLAINIPDSRKGMTPLHRAAMFGHTQCIRLLLEAKADCSLLTNQENGEKTALVLAYEQWTLSDRLQDFEESICMLIAADVDAARADIELAAICATNASVRLLKQLSQCGADLNCQDQYGWTPQQLARKFKHSECEEFLQWQAGEAGLLPSQWVTGPETMISEDGKIVTHKSQKRLCLSTNKPIPAWLSSFYFEVTVNSPFGPGDKRLEKEKPIIAVGLCTIGARAIRFPGWPSYNVPLAKSWGYHGDDGGLFSSGSGNGRPIKSGPTYKYGQTVGCGVDLEKEVVWFKLDGKLLDVQFNDVSGRLFPIIGLKDAIVVETKFNVNGLAKTVESKEQS